MKLLLIDDHALFREGVAALVEQRMPGVALHLAGDLNAARSVLAAHPDCRLALLDLGLPDSHGLDGIARLRELAPALPIVVLSADDRPETVLGAIDRGAAGFIPKSADSAAFAGALREVLDGRVHLPRQALLGADFGQFDDQPLDLGAGLGIAGQRRRCLQGFDIGAARQRR
jgi:DNA-binding NarL/FixJ family response regulator